MSSFFPGHPVYIVILIKKKFLRFFHSLEQSVAFAITQLFMKRHLKIQFESDSMFKFQPYLRSIGSKDDYYVSY